MEIFSTNVPAHRDNRREFACKCLLTGLLSRFVAKSLQLGKQSMHLHSYRMRSVTVLLWFGLICGCRATNSNGFLYPFGINSVLRCHVPNPFAGNPGEPDTVEEVAPRIAFVPGVNGSVWLPSESGYASCCLHGIAGIE